MPEPGVPSVQRDSFLIMLSAAAGAVDAITYLHGHAFPANMTGNTVVLAVSVVQFEWLRAIHNGLALAGFVAGAALGAWMVYAPEEGKEWTRRITRTLCVSAAILLLAGSTLFFFGKALALELTVLVTSISMGMQSAAIQRLAVSGVSTNAVTGTLTMVMTRWIERIRGTPEEKPQQAASPALPLASWTAYLIGAAMGALAIQFHDALPYAFPTLLMTGVAWKAARAGRSAA